MKIQVTCPVPEKNLQAGKIYDLPEKEAQELIKQEKAFAVEKTQTSKPKRSVTHDAG